MNLKNLNPIKLGKDALLKKFGKNSNDLKEAYAIALEKEYIVGGLNAINGVTESIGITIATKKEGQLIRVIEGVKQNRSDNIVPIFTPKKLKSDDVVLFIKPSSHTTFKILDDAKKVVRVISYEMNSEELNLIKLTPSKVNCYIQGVTNA